VHEQRLGVVELHIRHGVPSMLARGRCELAEDGLHRLVARFVALIGRHHASQHNDPLPKSDRQRHLGRSMFGAPRVVEAGLWAVGWRNWR
jgi:hypothetical protein